MLALSAREKRFYDDSGYLHLKGFYGGEEMAEMRRQFHELVMATEERPRNVSYSFMEPVAGYETDDFNPKNVVAMMDQTQANDYWFDQLSEPRIASVMVDLLGPNLDFHNGKIRNKPPGFTNTQGWHQDWPYVRHTEPDLAAAITYLDPTRADAGATELIPGSHLRGEWPTEDGAHTLVQEDVPAHERHVLEAECGDVAVIHVLLVHQAGHNRTQRSRNAIINEYKTAETVDKWNNRCAFAGLPLARNGRLVMPRVTSFAQ